MSAPNPYASPAVREVGPALELEPPQEVRYQLTEEDLVAAAVYSVANVPEMIAMHKSGRRLLMVVGTVSLTIAAIRAAAEDFRFHDGIVMPTLLAIMFWAVILNFNRKLRSQVAKTTRKQVKAGVTPIPDGNLRCVISGEGVFWEQPMMRSQIDWPRVIRVAQTADHLFLFIQPNFPITLPGRAFSSAERFEGFCRLAKRLWNEHCEARGG